MQGPACAPRRAHHDAVVDEAPAVPRGLQVRVLLRAGDLDAPDLLPGRVQLHVHRVDARVVRGHRVAHVGGDPVLLQDSQTSRQGSVEHSGTVATASAEETRTSVPLWETETRIVSSSGGSQPYTADGVTGAVHALGTWCVWLTPGLGFEHRVWGGGDRMERGPS